MNNDELKKKIVGVLSDNIRWIPFYSINRGFVYDDDLKNIADALSQVSAFFIIQFRQHLTVDF